MDIEEVWDELEASRERCDALLARLGWDTRARPTLRVIQGSAPTDEAAQPVRRPHGEHLRLLGESQRELNDLI